MRREIEKRIHENTKGIWNIAIDYEDQPNNRVTAHWIFYRISGPQGQEFTYRISYSHKVMKSSEYDTVEKRIEYGFCKACMWIDDGKYEDINWIEDTGGSRKGV
ncbi:MAG: hypothetical protein JSU77_03595 [Fidelibacterota bacterium]|nr:MAG: hypothetical protein JSU77_03595 [Candidatus Neomarinimicrobiota bacterium]